MNIYFTILNNTSIRIYLKPDCEFGFLLSALIANNRNVIAVRLLINVQCVLVNTFKYLIDVFKTLKKK